MAGRATDDPKANFERSLFHAINKDYHGTHYINTSFHNNTQEKTHAACELSRNPAANFSSILAYVSKNNLIYKTIRRAIWASKCVAPESTCQKTCRRSVISRAQTGERQLTYLYTKMQYLPHRDSTHARPCDLNHHDLAATICNTSE
jgi:hypothetical protein